MQGAAQTIDDEEDDERDELDALVDDTDDVDECDDEEVELVIEEEEALIEEATEEFDETEDNDELLVEPPLPVPGRNTSFPALPHADMPMQAATMTASERVFIGAYIYLGQVDSLCIVRY